jgi:hypothetical protein|tara:strand:- start:96 stop:275 length:180 start_codon:yes stop_codon:yes gene_type:complete
MKIKQLAIYCLDSILNYPSIELEIKEFYLLAISEIKEGGSEVHECEACYMSIEGLIQDL